MLPETVKWVEWFSLSESEAAHLDKTRHALELVGLCDEPDTVLEVGRFILSDPDAPEKLRLLAYVWERWEEAVPLLEMADSQV